MTKHPLPLIGLTAVTLLSLAACGEKAPAPAGAEPAPVAAPAEAVAPVEATPAVADDLAAREAELKRREEELALKERELAVERREAAVAQAPKVPRPSATPRPASNTSTSAPRPAPVAAAPVTVPSGTELALAMTSGVTTKTAKVGDPVQAVLTAPVIVGGKTVIPAGATVHGEVTEVISGTKKIGGHPTLGLAFNEVRLEDGRRLGINAKLTQVGRKETNRDAAKIAGGALVGAIVGDQVSDKNSGKIVGAVLGGAAGAAIAHNTGGEVEIKDGGALTIALTSSVTVPAK
jgi:Glycine zipper 2TM domain